MLPSSWPSICRFRRSPLECLSHPALPSTCCELQWTAWHCSGVIPSLMQPDCLLRAFNAEVTSSSTIALSPCSHSCAPTLVPSFGDDGEDCGGWRIALSSQDTSLPRTWRSLTISPSSFEPSLAILWRFPPRLGPRAYYSKWAGAPRSFGPTQTISHNLQKCHHPFRKHNKTQVESWKHHLIHFDVLQKTEPQHCILGVIFINWKL